MQLLQFCREINSDLHKLCQPLWDHSYFNKFAYTRYFNNHDFITICSDLSWSERYFANMQNGVKFEEQLREATMSKHVHVFFGDTSHKIDPVMEMLFDHKIINFVNLHVVERDKIHAWSFSVPHTFDHPHDYYIKSLSSIWEFARYFLDVFEEKYGSSIETYKDTFPTSIKVFGHENENHKLPVFSSKSSLKQVRVFHEGAFILIHRLSWELLSLMARGYSNKQISEILNRTEKAIDKRILKLKEEFNIYSRDKLIQVWHDNQLIL